jgi:hypothetical protein
MEMHKDDRVRMPAKPEWGMGQVMRDPAAGKVCILFREAGEKVLSLKHAKLVGVEGEEAHDLWLDNLNLEVSPPGSRYLGPREAAETFLAKYPGGFRDQAYLEGERASKVAAHELMKELLDQEALTLLREGGQIEDVCTRALRVIGKTDLVFPSDRTALSRALKVEDQRDRFASALADQLYGDDDAESRFKRFTDTLEGLGAARWTLATYFPFIRFPGEHFFLKPTLTQNAAVLCRFDLGYRPEPNRLTYRRLLTFAHLLGEVLGTLEPADMFDLQAFVSCLAQVKR